MDVRRAQQFPIRGRSAHDTWARDCYHRFLRCRPRRFVIQQCRGEVHDEMCNVWSYRLWTLKERPQSAISWSPGSDPAATFSAATAVRATDSGGDKGRTASSKRRFKMNSTIINAQRNARTDNRMRIRFRCIEWDTETQRGCLIDRTKFQFEVSAADLLPECGGSLDVGEYVSGTISGESVANILIESGPRAVGLFERKEFESMGPHAEVKGWDPHRGNSRHRQHS
jgi:hypothetical protein